MLNPQQPHHIHTFVIFQQFLLEGALTIEESMAHTQKLLLQALQVIPFPKSVYATLKLMKDY